ncbi:UDP-glucose--hexose-1-phosphate uridylyltransferase [Jeotgalibacillus aurantiacus]|uniref:UDP-glucose--hexose-1-phosphate uridylyltransferase n=1 Tax=Jeotgalibacillus aurantiacus TaxID=2763266 RepID=UPI001D0A2DD5|nr:UDP-glucose--hexose-1-phosphate uridylyltransferase [Jeotgalibacillus aurantiacus]
MTMDLQIERLLQFGIQKALIQPEDKDYTRNRMLNVLQKDSTDQPGAPDEKLDSAVPILRQIIDLAKQQEELGLETLNDEDQLDAALMDCLMPRPSEVRQTFSTHYQKHPGQATDYFYQLSKDSNYIRMDRIAKNEHWYSKTEFGQLEITINLSKPEKDPKTIAAERNAKTVNYPLCLLCKENEGYAGRVNHPARHNHRIIDLNLNGEPWFFQYSPYVYYNEHAIVFSEDHRPMKVSKEGFERLLAFVEQFPHYFVGSNADLPIVGGSILSHDHFQGGRHTFPMAKAESIYSFELSGFDEVEAEIVKWPMSVLRLRSKDRKQLAEAGGFILNQWKQYSDPEADVLAESAGEKHNTITPIARMNRDRFELDLVLRNNRTTDEHPLGLFHPHEEVHAIKKENIGLIEVMGLAVLPGRLKEELAVLGGYLASGNLDSIDTDERTAKHAAWAKALATEKQINTSNVEGVLKQRVGEIFATVLSHAGVFKQSEEGLQAFKRFTNQLSSVRGEKV